MGSCLYPFIWQACDLAMIILVLTFILVIIFVLLHTSVQLIFDVVVVVYSMKFFWKTVNGSVFGVIDVNERLYLFHSIKVVPDAAPGVCAETNARKDALVRPAHVVTAIHSVAHGLELWKVDCLMKINNCER